MYSYDNNNNKFPYSQKIWREIKFGGLAVYITSAKLKSAKISYLHIICMAIPYRTDKFKSTNILAIAILGSNTKFNSHQYFRLYDIMNKIRFLEKSLPV